VGSRAAADEDRKPVDRERLLLPCLPPPAVRVTVTCNNKKKHTKKQSVLILLFCRSASLRISIFFSFPLVSLFQAAGGVTIGLLAFGFCPVCSCRWPVNLWTALCRRNWRKTADRSKSVSAAVFGLVWRL
jgi:hypothetical protein